jgi:hypothetical protein
MIAGICAGVISNLVSHPLDTLKVRMQLKTGEPLKLLPTIQDMYHREGVNINFILLMHDNFIVKRIL